MEVIRVENVSKMYRLGSVGTSTLTEDVRLLWQKLRRKNHLPEAEENDRVSGGSSRFVWALKDVDFSVNHGEILGIVGRNGAGKSTLLKILSRTTAPTTGTIKMRGRVASLLEVGTGFHPDLTGRENIYLNGAILGMRKADIKAQFDSIVEFAGVQRYVDTPVKRYSSGMYVRLAFAVAAHLDPDILIIDEVLAVGDAEFQAKCLGKMKDVAEQGRTVLFVSHNMGAVSDLCTRAILMSKGSVQYDGPTEEVIRRYVQQNMTVNLTAASSLDDTTVRRGNGAVRFTSISIADAQSGQPLQEAQQYQSIDFLLECRINEPVEELLVFLGFRSGKTRDIVTSTGRIPVDISNLQVGDSIRMSIRFPAINLRMGVYETYFWLGSSNLELPYDVVDNLIQPVIIQPPPGINPLLLNGYFDDKFTFTQHNAITPSLYGA